MVLYKESCRERIIMKRKIGEIFELHNEWYQCIEGRCKDCYFSEKRFLCKQFITKNFCTSGIIFKKLEKVGEPITVNGKNVQLLKTTIANCDNCAFYKDVNCDFTCYPRKCHGGEEGTYVEIKTKEDMEEKKLNLKPFDIQKAREGKPVCTRGGRKARIIYFDAKGDYPIVALIETENGEKVVQYMIDGHCTNIISQCYDDLMMLPEKKEGWVNVYKHNLYDTESEAKRAHVKEGYIDTIKIEWEE